MGVRDRIVEEGEGCSDTSTGPDGRNRWELPPAQAPPAHPRAVTVAA